MEEKNEYIVDLFQEELDKRNKQQQKKIDKYKKQEEKKRKKELKKLEKEEDKGFARQQKLSRNSKYLKKNKFNLSLIYKIFIIAILFITLTYFIYSLITNNLGIIKSILFTLMILSFILSSTIQKKKERKISFIVASSLAIIWMLMNL